jgi:hypothetical protein
MGCAKLLAGVDPTARPAQPFAMEQKRSCELGPYGRPRKPIDRFAVEGFGAGVLAKERPRSRLDAEREVRSAGSVTSASLSSASRATVGSSLRTAASTSSGSTHIVG